MSKSSFILPAPELKTEYHLFLDTPKEVHAMRLVVVLDGDDQFAAAVEAAREIERERVIPPLALVGVGYGGGYRSPVNRRIRDYTPTQPKGEPMESGGAEAFHAFLEHRLVPALVERWGAAPLSVGLTGHSLSSLFGLHALFRPQPFFDHFILSSPSIWWDDRAILQTVRGSPAFSATSPRKAFISVGEDDTPSMTGDLSLFEDELKNHPRRGLHYTVERFPKRDHYNVLPLAFRQGFRWLYSADL